MALVVPVTDFFFIIFKCFKLMMSDQIIKNFMYRCKQKYRFTLPAIYSRFATRAVDTNIIDTVIYNNNMDMLGAATTVKNFIKLLFEMKVCIKKVVGEEYSVEVFNSLGYMEE